MTFLVGSLGRAAIGEAIDRIGYAPVFRFTALIGLIAVGFVIAEWIRQSLKERRRTIDGPVPASDAARATEGDTA